LLALAMMSAGGVRADTVVGADGTPGAFCDPSGDEDCDINGGEGESVFAGGNQPWRWVETAVKAGAAGTVMGTALAMAATAVLQRLALRAVRLFRLRRQEAAAAPTFLLAGMAVTPSPLATR
jgi:hypothetical protein